MAKKSKRTTQIQKKLLKLFESIEDVNVQEIIKQSIPLESMYRSSSQFPMRELREIINAIANRIETERGEE